MNWGIQFILKICLMANMSKSLSPKNSCYGRIPWNTWTVFKKKAPSFSVQPSTPMCLKSGSSLTLQQIFIERMDPFGHDDRQGSSTEKASTQDSHQLQSLLETTKEILENTDQCRGASHQAGGCSCVRPPSAADSENANTPLHEQSGLIQTRRCFFFF